MKADEPLRLSCAWYKQRYIIEEMTKVFGPNRLYLLLFLTVFVISVPACAASTTTPSPTSTIPGAVISWKWQNPLPQGNLLRGVWGSSNNDVFAVGNNGTILHYNGSMWSSINSGTTNYLAAVWGSSPSDVFTVGNNGTILHYNGNAWSQMSSGATTTLRGIWGTSSDIFAVGEGGTILLS